MKINHKSLFAISGTVVAILLQACAGYPTYERGLRVKYADEAGSVSISQSAVTDWDEVASDLQPNFKMDSATAFNNAIPITQSLDERLADLLSANLQVGLPTASSTRIRREVTNPETGELTTSEDNTRTALAGTVPPPGPLAPGTAAALTALSAGTFGDDPMLRYLAATALQQEVTLLNRYVRDRVRWPGAQAFVVQLQLTVIPNGRSLPYDVETDVTLHANDEQSRARLAFQLELPRGPNGEPAPGQRVCGTGSLDTLQVLPMIVTDNLEGLRAARATDNVRQLALALVGTAGNVGAAGQFARTTEELRRTEGRDTNSLFTIARLSDDTVRVRLGAVQSPRYGYVTVPRNHRISLVVIYRPCLNADRSNYEDRGTRIITAVTRTTFRDAETGQALEYQNATERLRAQILGIRDRFTGQFNYLELARMYQWATRQERERYFDYVVRQHVQAHSCHPSILARLLGVEANWQASREDYRDMAETQDYVLQPRYGVPPRDEVQRPDLPTPATEVPAHLRATTDARCLTLARMRYELVAAPLWTELQSIRPNGQFAYTNIPITLRRSAPTLPPRQVALVNFAANESSVVLSQGQDLSPFRNIRMVLVGAPDGPIPATTTTVAPNGRAISATFPPLARFGIQATASASQNAQQAAGRAPLRGRRAAQAVPPAAPAPPTYKLELQVPVRSSQPYPCGATATLAPADGQAGSAPSPTAWRVGEVRAEGEDCILTYPVRLHNAAAPTPNSPFGIEAAASGIIANPSTGTGRLIVVVTRSQDAAAAPDSLFLTVEGAQLSTAQLRNGTRVTPEARGWRITAPGELILDLENLIPNTVVKVNLRDGQTAAGSVSRSVVAGVLRLTD